VSSDFDQSRSPKDDPPQNHSIGELLALRVRSEHDSFLAQYSGKLFYPVRLLRLKREFQCSSSSVPSTATADSSWLVRGIKPVTKVKRQVHTLLSSFGQISSATTQLHRCLTASSKIQGRRRLAGAMRVQPRLGDENSLKGARRP